ncbi:hypothetical protein IIA_05395 [Bacillus cereus VD014]|uniref:Transposase n=1 Tax=Bacillus cereus (strain VD014) TaxID=1053223 RepID=A0A9W5NMP5_BACC8|nr:hypothetical protein IIA_05395 [Bacillus cereus VD014]KLA29562.1 hypothetical protein B4080_6218 [Bacillus cereus]
MNSLQPGQTCEIADAYVGMIDKVPARVIVHRLTKQQQQKRLQDQAVREKKKGMKYSPRSKRLNGGKISSKCLLIVKDCAYIKIPNTL